MTSSFPSLRRFELLVFDWDGTLSDSTGLIVRCLQHACRDLGIKAPDDTQAAYVIGLGLYEALKIAAPGLSEDLYPQLSARYRHHYLSRAHELSLFPGTLGMLQAVKARGHKLAVATGKTRRGLDDALNSSTLKHVFDSSRTADETASKPDPTMLLELMDELGVAPQATLMIGDTTHDLMLAANAEVPSLAVSYGAHESAAFQAYGPLAVVHSTTELQNWLIEHA